MGLIEDEQEIAALASQVGQGGTELRQEAVEGVSRFNLESQENLTVEGGHLEVGVGQVSDRIEVAVEAMDEGAQGSGFAGADIAGDEGGQSFLEGKGQPALNFLVSMSGEQVGGGEGAAERGLFEVVMVIEGGHHAPPGWDQPPGQIFAGEGGG